MQRALVGLLVGLFGCAPAPNPKAGTTATTPRPAAQGSHQARCCLVAVGPAGESVYKQGSKPAKLRLYAQADQDAEMLVAGFANGSLSRQFPGKVISLKAGQPFVRELPAGAATDLYVTFLQTGSEDAEQAGVLAEKYTAKPEPDGPPAQRMFQLLTEWAGETGEVQRGGKLAPEVGGVRITAAQATHPQESDGRSKQAAADGGGAPPAARPARNSFATKLEEPEFNWQTSADVVRYDSDVHGVVVYTVSAPTR